MSQLFVLPKPLNINANLQLVAGAKAFFYQTGTTTPQDTYQDSGLTTPHANPVVADAAGVLPPIYLDDESSTKTPYKLTLRTSSDALIYTVDPINPFLLTQALIGLKLYPRTAAEQAAGITPTLYYYPPGDIRRYGAVDGGVTDCTTAITNAINIGQPVFIPAGTWRITAALPLIDNLYIRGEGPDAVLLVDNVAISPFSNGTGTSVIYMDIGNFTIRANVTVTGSCLNLVDVSRSCFHDIIIDRAGAGDAFAYAIRLSGSASACYWNQFFNIEATAVKSGFCRISTGSNDNFFYDCRLINHVSAYQTPSGVWIENGSNNCFFGLTLEAIWEDTTPADAYCIRLDTNAVCNGFYNVRTEGHVGTVNTYAVYWNGGVANEITRHNLLGVSSSTGTIGSNTWRGIYTVSGEAAAYIGGTQMRVPTNTADPATDNGSINYNTSTSKLMAFVAGAAVELCPATSGTFTGTLTGVSGSVTGTCRWVKNGNTVTFYIPSLSGTSNATTMTITGAPSNIFPARSQRITGILMQDNSVVNTGTVNVGTDGVLTFGYGPTEAAFTNSGTKGPFSNTFTYSLT